MGELLAWIIGWDLVLEYAVGVGDGLDQLVDVRRERFCRISGSICRRHWWRRLGNRSHSPNGSVIYGIINLPAVFIVVRRLAAADDGD